MNKWGYIPAHVPEDQVVCDPDMPNFTSLELDIDGEKPHETPEEMDDWGPEDYGS